MTVAPRFPSRKKNVFLEEADWVEPTKLYASLSVMLFLLERIDKGDSFKENIKTLIQHHPEVSLKKMGFTQNWLTEPYWQ